MSPAGDSRCVLCEAGGKAVSLTRDHKPEISGEHERIYKVGAWPKWWIVGWVSGWVGRWVVGVGRWVVGVVEWVCVCVGLWMGGLAEC